tara:strand:+ start:746 stop:880 length:135 start_codon:yes stop_codon:yes gene_type:complete
MKYLYYKIHNFIVCLWRAIVDGGRDYYDNDSTYENYDNDYDHPD